MAFKRRKDLSGDVSTCVIESDLESAPSKLFGELLVDQGLLSAEALADALSRQQGQPLGRYLVENKLLNRDAVPWALARQRNLNFVDLTPLTPTAEALEAADPNVARTHKILPFRLVEGRLDVAIDDPASPQVRHALERLPVERVRVFVAPTSQLERLLDQHYDRFSDLDALAQSAVSTLPADGAEAAIDLTQDDAPIVRIVNRIVQQALRERASDVHLEPKDDRLRVRFRIDGSLKDVTSLPADLTASLTSRIKIMAEMNIVERRRPQDGQFRLDVDGRELDVRVSTTATIWGEKTVMRLLDKSKALLRLTDLGMPAHTNELYSQITKSPFGMLVVSGPTGSGKTTTLYATLAEINRPDLNVMTVEDPVEYIVPSINQIQINETAGLSFATGLKSILRQDPDVILVGEMRDAETARIAVQSALTGHFVLSTVHATDTVAALYRVLNMGVETFAIASSIVGMVAQRLVRRICTKCAYAYVPAEQELAFYRLYGGVEKELFSRGKGCADCSGTGYYDRIGVYEVLAITDDIRQALVANTSPTILREIALKQGLRTLREEAIALVADDITTIDEVIRTVYVAEGTG